MKKTIVAGTMRWGKWGAQKSPNEQASMIQKWLENGVHWFDLANLYGDYSCEKEFGDSLKLAQINRFELKLISKMGIEKRSEERGNFVKHYNYSSKHIVASVDQSLRNLKTDFLDVLLLHRPSPLLQVEQVVEAVSALKSQGKIREFGVSNFLPSQIEILKKGIEIQYNQISFSLNDIVEMENGNLEFFASKEISVSAYSPVVRVDSASDDLKVQLQRLAEKYNCTSACIAVAWVLKHPLISSVVVGTSSESRIPEMQKSLNVDLDLQDYFKLWEAARGTEVP